MYTLSSRRHVAGTYMLIYICYVAYCVGHMAVNNNNVTERLDDCSSSITVPHSCIDVDDFIIISVRVERERETKTDKS